MADQVKVTVVYCPATGTVSALARAAASAAEKAGAEVRLRAVSPDPDRAATEVRLRAVPAGPDQALDGTEPGAEASLDDLGWADVILIGSPVQEGLLAAPIRRFMDSAGLLWSEGRLANKIVSSFTSCATTLSDGLHGCGSIIIPPGPSGTAIDSGHTYGDRTNSGSPSRASRTSRVNGAGPDPAHAGKAGSDPGRMGGAHGDRAYGDASSCVPHNGGVPLARAELAAVEAQARRAVEIAQILKRGRAI